jgi:beta-glucanase (GH16 family)
MTIDPTHLASTATMTFDDEFNNLSLWNGSSGTWATTFIFADPHANGSSLPGNGEQEWYINSMYGPTAGVKPWTVSNGVLSLTAAPTPSSVSSYLGYSNAADGAPGLGSYHYTSGLITSAHSFTQTYGYFEMSAKLPQGQGLWPAFWLLPANGKWPPELDVMEVLGNNTNTLYTTGHTNETGAHTSNGVATTTPDLSSAYHTYGIDWEADKITWYFDGQAVHTMATPADMHSPMYMLANLAVGGNWPGSPDGSTTFPAHMDIDYIRAYTALPDGTGSAASTSPAEPISSTPQVINGTSSADLYMGGSGGDQIFAGGGADTVNGRIGADTITGGEGNDWLYGGKDNDSLSGDAGSDTLLANIGADTVDGSAGADTLRGGQGDDVLRGGDGADWMSGDRGSDTLTGGAGADTFHVFAGAGTDVVMDFNILEHDRVQVDAGVTWTVSQAGADVHIDLSSGDEMVLHNVQLSSLTGGWIFSA